MRAAVQASKRSYRGLVRSATRRAARVVAEAVNSLTSGVEVRGGAAAASVEGLEPRCLLSVAANLLPNGDVETGTTPTNWTWYGKTAAEDPWTQAEIDAYWANQYPSASIGRAQHEWVRDTARAYAGTGALRLESEAPANDPTNKLHGAQQVDGYWLSDAMPCTAGTAYVADAWLNLSRPLSYGEWYGPLQIRFYNASGTLLASSNSVRSGIFSVIPRNTWTYGATMPYVAPTGAVTMKLRFGQEFCADDIDGGGDGTMIADNLAVWQLPSEVRIPAYSEVLQDLPSYINWFREATATVQPPYLASPADTTTYSNVWGTVDNAVAGNLYYDKSAPAAVSMVLTNLLGENRNLSLRVTRSDWLGNASSPITIPAQALSGFGTTTFSATLPATNSYGAFYLNVEVMQDASVVGTFAGRYAVLPPLTRPDTAKNIWGVMGKKGDPTTILSDQFLDANGTSLTLSGNTGQTKTDTYTPTGDTIAYTLQHQGSTAFNVSLTGKQNAVGVQSGLTLTNNTGQTITATSGEVYASVNVATQMGWTAGSITVDQIKTLVLGFDYVSSGFTNPVSAGIYVVNGASEFFASAALAATTDPTHKAIFLSSLSPEDLQTFTNLLNANGGTVRIRFAYSGNISAGASLSAADFMLSSTSLADQDLGKVYQTAGYGLAWVRLVDTINDLAMPSAITDARRIVEWYRNLGLRCVLQVYGNKPYTTPIDTSAIYSAGQSIATNFKGIVAAIGDWGVEQSNHRTPDDAVYRPFDQNGVMMDDATYDTILVNLYNGLKSIAPSLPVLIGNIATAGADAYYGDAIARMYGSPVNGSFDGAILNVYYNQAGMPNVSLEMMDRHGDTDKNIWIEENADSDVALGPTGENVGANRMIMWRVTQAAKFNGRIEAVTQWMFGSGKTPNHTKRDNLTQAIQPRPHFVAQAVMADALADATYVGDHSINNTSTNSWDYPDVGMYEWQRGDGPMWIAFKYGGSASRTFNVTSGSLTVMDLMGNRTVIPAVNGQVTLTLTNSPVYLFGGGTISNGIPIAPTGLRAVAGPSSVKLSWNAVPGATGYMVYRGTFWSGKDDTADDPYPTDHYGLVATISGGATTSFLDLGRTSGMTYFYRVTAIAGTAESGKSNEQSVVALANSTPTLVTAATASSSPVYGTTTNLSVLADDAEGESGLTYTWSALGTPPAPVAFSLNGSNAAKNTVATFTKGGAYTFQVTATDVGGMSVTSSVTVVAHVPYLGTAPAVPGIVDFVDYDTGGEGVGYHDTSASNYGNLYRLTEGVDVKPCTDTAYGKPYMVGWASAGEWMNYTVNVATAGRYTVAFRVSSVAGGTRFHLENEAGVNLTGTLTTPATGNLDVWASVLASVTLPAGSQVLSLRIDDANANYHSMIFSLSDAVPTVTVPAAASPNPVSATTTSLSVMGDDEAGEASLVYTWATIGAPPAGVTLSDNGTNAAKNTTATFTKAGSYSFQVSITNTAGLTTTSTVNVLVSQTLTSITVSPATAAVPAGATQQFTATASDQFGDALASQPAFTWSLASGAGSVNASGLYTAPAGGTATVRATSGSVNGTASVTVSNNAPTVVTPAAVSANPVTSPTATLTVLGADDGGESSLTYTWATIGNPPAGVTFSANGTNAAKNTIATFSKSGTYNFQVTITDPGGLTTTSTINVAVVAPAIYMTATDPAGSSSFSVGARWSDMLIPHAIGDYYNVPSAGSTAYNSVRTPSTGATAVFAGESLHLMGPSSGGSLHLKGPDGQVVTINNLYLQNGATINADIAVLNYTLAGGMIINGGTAPVINPVAVGKTLTISASISGPGPLNFVGTAAGQTTIVSSTNNTLSGLVTLTNNITVAVGGTLSLGTGNIALNNSAKLTLSGAANNNYIADTANLNATSSCKVNLNFTGTDYVGSVTIAGVTYTSGTFDSTHASGVFTGTGRLVVNSAPTVATPAAANPNPDNGTTANLSVLGADDQGESGLTYTWATTGTPPAGVRFSANGTNAAKNAVATFAKAGSYTFQVTIADSAGKSVTSSVNVTVNQTLSSIIVSPATATVGSNGTQQFAATARDQFGDALATQPTFTWSFASGTGSVDASGLYTAPSGAASATLMATSGSMNGTASVTVIFINTAPTVAKAAAASNPVTGTTTNLSVLGADDAGEGNLTYTWVAISSPALVTFSDNATNAAKNVIATFTKAGDYSFQVTITDSAGLTTTSTVSVSVDQRLTSIAVTPATASVRSGATRQFAATACDQFGDTLASQPAFAWSADSGSVDASGLFTASYAAGSATVTATSGSVNGTATLTVTNAAPTVATPAAASANPVTGPTTGLSVLGADDSDESLLIYTWATIGNPPAAVTFSANGTNAAKSTSITFTKAGTYNLQVTITDPAGLSTTSTVSVIVVAPAIYLQATDATGVSSIAGGTNWSDLLAPHAIGNYYNQPSSGSATYYSIRTPDAASATNVLFNGDSLHLAGGGNLIFKGPEGQALTINNLYLNNATIHSFTAGRNYSLNGNMIVEGSTASTIGSVAAGKIFTINSAITGSGPLSFTATAAGQTTFVSSTNNTLSGLVTVTSAITVLVGGTLSLGTGNIAMSNAAKLTLSGATDNNYIADTATLNVTSSCKVNLNFTGTDYVWGITIGGITYTAGAFDSTHSSGIFTGTGRLVIVNSAPTVATPATANPVPVAGKTTALSVLGADDHGESGLTYTWATTGTPPAAVTFSANGANAARNTTATFTKAGAYSFQVTIKDSGGLTTTSTVNVTVNQTFTSIAVSPIAPTVVSGATQQFTATAKDQFGDELASQPAFGWSNSGAGSVDANGLYTGSYATGSATVTATSGSVSNAASVTVTNAAPTVATEAAASPGTVTGNTTDLSVLGADDAGEHNLSYFWTIVDAPAAVTFADSNAKATSVTFAKAGAYSFQVTITDAGGLSTTSSVNVNVEQTLTSITVTPATTSVVSGGTQQFAATGYDQFGDELASQPTFSWSLGSAGVLDANGLYTASYAAGEATVTATSGSVSSSASVTVTNAAPTLATESAANPGAVTGNTAELSVLGADDAGEGNLSYSWTVVNAPAAVIFGDSNAKNTPVTFAKAGSYRFQVTITDAGGLSTTSSVNVNVEQTLTSIAVTPAGLGMPQNSTAQYSAAGLDQFGDLMAVQPSFSWSATGGSISGSGLLTAGAAEGDYRVTATSGGVTGSVSYAVFPLAPAAVTMQVNDGNVQRSMVNSLTLTFDKPVYLPSNAITITRRGGAVNFAIVITPGLSTTHVLTFSGTDIVGGSLPDGVYTLILDASAISDAYGQVMTGGSREYSFHRLFSDVNGSGQVNGIDKQAVKDAMRQSAYVWYLDYDGNGGVIDDADYTEHHKRMGRPLL